MNTHTVIPANAKQTNTATAIVRVMDPATSGRPEEARSDRAGEKPGWIRLFSCKCPRCRRGDMFVYKNPYNLRNFMKMNKICPVCGQPLDLEPGFYYGTSYVSYAFSIALSVASFIAWWLLVGLSLHDNRIFYWMIFNGLLLISMQTVLMRLSRTIWLAFFVYYDPDWRTPPKEAERINPDQMDAW